MTEMTRAENVASVRKEWTAEAIKAFETLRDALIGEHILQHPDWSLPFEIHTDASKVGLGVVLSQTQNGREVVIWYESSVERRRDKVAPT